MFFDKEISSQHLDYGITKEYYRTHIVTTMQYRLGVRLPLLRPRSWAIHLSPSDGIGLARHCRGVVTTATAMGEA